jgi:hypothetical protein
MKKISILLALPALLAGVGWSLFAGDGPEPRSKGTVLLLTNERAFEGDIEKIGDLYRVRKGPGEVVVPAAQALRLCADWDEALAFMRSRANLGDPDERLRLAKWCQLNHQIERARIEARVALEMRPKHFETRQLVKLLEITTTPKSAKPAVDPLPPIPRIDLSFESVTAFNQKVQPILMNTCINCHSGAYTGKFRLYRLNEGGDRAATQRNLAAVLAQVYLDKPAASPLLVMAVSAHGNAKTSPLPGRQAPTFLALCTWLDQTLADNPQLHEKGAVAIPATLPASVAKAPDLSRAAPAKAEPGAVPVPSELPGVVVSQAIPLTPQPAASNHAPVATAEALGDPFAPGPFNRWAHPDKK